MGPALTFVENSPSFSTAHDREPPSLMRLLPNARISGSTQVRAEVAYAGCSFPYGELEEHSGRASATCSGSWEDCPANPSSVGYTCKRCFTQSLAACVRAPTHSPRGAQTSKQAKSDSRQRAQRVDLA